MAESPWGLTGSGVLIKSSFSQTNTTIHYSGCHVSDSVSWEKQSFIIPAHSCSLTNLKRNLNVINWLTDGEGVLKKKPKKQKRSLSGYRGALGESLYKIRILFHPNEIKLTTVMSLWHNKVLSEVFASRLNKSAVMERCGGTQMQINDLFIAKLNLFGVITISDLSI